MRFAAYRQNGIEGLAAATGSGPFRGFATTDSQYPASLASLVAHGSEHLLAAGRALLTGPEIDLGAAEFLPPLPAPPRS
ncbi:MAG: fumarylacetoacetate hydrolase, partial [Lasallia pustulata]